MIYHRTLKCGLFLVLFLVAVTQTSLSDDKVRPVADEELRQAAANAIKIMQRSQGVWFKKQTCTSCHHQLIPEITLRLARESGVAFDQAAARESTAAAFAYLKDLDEAIQGSNYIDAYADAWALVAAHAAGVKPTLGTAAYARLIASHQLPDGSWRTVDSRPPQAHSPFSTTAVCVLAMRHYLPDEFNAEKESRVRRARDWLLKAQPRNTEDRTFQILGLRSTEADDAALQRAARQLVAEQRPDGGWAQLPGRNSDAYATGEALFALSRGAGYPTSDPAFQRGLRFLLKTQQQDGSWRVETRLHPPAPVSPPYFNSEFPYGRDQFISMMGTSWAATALLTALPASPDAIQAPAPDLGTAEQDQWIRTAMIGSAAQLKKALDAGLNPNSKTAQGTTALMLAAYDADKVKLLIERGADVNARAASGFTALMVASRYRGNDGVLRLLLNKGARPNADKGVEVRSDASALFFAVTGGDTQSVQALLDAGATPSSMKVLGFLAISPLVYATVRGEPALVELLINRGANPNEVDSDGISSLGWATILNHADTVRALLARGARVNHVDKLGMTPLLYAASIDYGDTAVMQRLIAAGADLKAKNKEGLTALDLAKSYKHGAMERLLSGSTSPR